MTTTQTTSAALLSNINTAAAAADFETVRDLTFTAAQNSTTFGDEWHLVQQAGRAILHDEMHAETRRQLADIRSQLLALQGA